MAKTIIQVPIEKTLRDRASSAVLAMGFSSLQDSIRVFLTQMVEGNYRVRFEPKTINLSKKAIKRYEKINNDIDSGKAKMKSFTNVNDLMEYLNT